MPRIFSIFLLSLFLIATSCSTEKPCSGLNPEIGTYNTSKKIHSGRKSAHSRPEKKAIAQRQKEIKNKKHGFSTKGRYTGGGFFHFHIGGGGGSGGGNIQSQSKN